jgi:hypothetical protein
MSDQIPLGPKHLKCPLWQKPMDKVCHTCPLWTFMRAEDPRTGEMKDKWDCALAWGPMLLVDLIRRQDHTTASVDKVSNVMNEINNMQIGRARRTVGMKLIED